MALNDFGILHHVCMPRSWSLLDRFKSGFFCLADKRWTLYRIYISGFFSGFLFILEEGISKKPLTIENQIATDEQGRRRFHGAFTGGFSAGYYNTVGSETGWTPTTFKSSREQRAVGLANQRPEDFMDTEVPSGPPPPPPPQPQPRSPYQLPTRIQQTLSQFYNCH